MMDDWLVEHHKIISRSAITLHEQIGQGSFKKVFRGSLSVKGARQATTVAVSHILFHTIFHQAISNSFSHALHRQYYCQLPNMMHQVLQVQSGDVAAEAKVLRRLGQHPRLVRFFGVCGADATDGTTWLVVEYAKLGSLDKVLEEHEDDMTPAHRLAMLQQMCAGMEALAEANGGFVESSGKNLGWRHIRNL
jgi:serine/threonine protein kinase